MTVFDLQRTALLLLLTLGLATGASAQQTSDGDSSAESPEPTVVPVGEIGARSEALETQLVELQGQRAAAVLADFDVQLQKLEADMAAAVEQVDALATGPVTPLQVEAQSSSWKAFDSRFETLQDQVGAEVEALDQRLEKIAGQTELWSTTLEQARDEKAPDGLLRNVDQAVAALAAAKKQVGVDLARVLALQDRVREAHGNMRPTLERVEAAVKQLSEGILIRDDEPVWSSIPSREALAAVPGEVHSRLSVVSGIGRQARDHRDRLIVLGIVFVFMTLFFSRTRAARDRLSPERASSSADALRHPLSAALLITVLLMPVVQLDGVREFRFVATPLGLIAWFRVLSGMLAPALRAPLIGLVVLMLFELFRSVIIGLPVLDRGLLGFDLAAALAAVIWLRRPERLQYIPWQADHSPWLKLVGFWMRLLTPALAVGLLAALLGYTTLADRIALLAIRGTALGAGWVALVRIVETVAEQIVEGGSLDRVHMIRSSRAAFLRVARLGLRGFGLFVWVYATLKFAGFWSPAKDAVTALLSASVGYGSVSVSLKGVLAFFLTLWFSWLLARFTSFALNKEVFTRLHMPPGVPFALSTFSRYAILVIGFVIAMAAIGFPIDRVTLLLSALGVGIGFGLQNVVNHFVSGAILLFERPIRVGDRVQLDELFGDVSTIGIRASTVRTVDGADVIVPNGDLISARVTNWTYADRKRRLILPVGVAYGSNPRQVIELLTEVAKSLPDIVSYPEPLVLFRGFGNSSLDFEIRAFTEADFINVMSDLGVATSEALAAAGITIPFPQRDLHLRNVPELRDALKEAVRDLER